MTDLFILRDGRKINRGEFCDLCTKYFEHPSIAGGLERYCFDRLMPGSGLRSIIAGRGGMGAWEGVDRRASPQIDSIRNFIVSELPRHMCGSPEAVDAWVNGGGDEDA